MKINATGIDAYRNITGESQIIRKPVNTDGTSQTDKVNIPVQEKKPGSQLAVHLKNGSFIDMLSPEEKKALEMIFEKFRGTESRSYEKDGEVDKPRLGSIVDIKL